MHFPALRETVQQYKENPEKEIEDWLKEEHADGVSQGLSQGLSQGEKNGENKTILAMLKHGMPAETIAQAIGWTNEKVRELGRLNGIL